MNRPQLADLTIKLEVVKGRDLIAKDRNIFGMRATADPYVMLHIGHKMIGVSKVAKRALSPVWNHEFQNVLGAYSAARALQQRTGKRQRLTAILTIWDDGSIDRDDTMGTVVVPLDPLSGNSTQWYPVGKGTGNAYCKNAKGDLEVKVTFEGHNMPFVARGQAWTLLHNRICVGLAWDVERGQHVDLDSSVVAVDRYGQVLMEETVYYGNLKNPSLSVQHSGDARAGGNDGDDEKIFLELDRVPSKVLALYIILTVATPGKTFNDVRSAQARLVSTESRQGICHYVPHLMGDGNTALFLCRISRQASNWILTPIEEGNTFARDFGTLIPEIKGYTRDLVPDLVVDHQEHVATMRKGGTIRVSDYVPGGKVPPCVSFGLTWDVDVTNGVKIDLDASAILLDSDYQLLEVVYFRHLTSKDGSVRHSREDESEGNKMDDDEIINVSLHIVSPNTKYIGFVINSFRGQDLDDVAKAACHLFDPATNTDIATYTLSNSKELASHTALLVGCLLRGDNPDEWFLNIISKPLQGRIAKQNVEDLQTFLSETPPHWHTEGKQPGAASAIPGLVPIDEEEETLVCGMPDAEPIADEEIVVVRQSDFFNYTVPVEQDIAL